jgi:type I restriction-modification system DNA methylase subunit
MPKPPPVQGSIFDINVSVKRSTEKQKPKHRFKDFRGCLEKITRGGKDNASVFNCFVKLSACALSLKMREGEYMEEIKRWSKDDLDLFMEAFSLLVSEMESNEFSDILGKHYMEWSLSDSAAKSRGEFHTPECLCRMMAKSTITPESIEEAVSKKGYFSVSEPSCGAGATILAIGHALAESGYGHLIRKLSVEAIDINKTSCDMCFINTTLWGIPCRVVHGNTLSQEKWNEWENIHFRYRYFPSQKQVER